MNSQIIRHYMWYTLHVWYITFKNTWYHEYCGIPSISCCILYQCCEIGNVWCCIIDKIKTKNWCKNKWFIRSWCIHLAFVSGTRKYLANNIFSQWPSQLHTCICSCFIPHVGTTIKIRCTVGVKYPCPPSHHWCTTLRVKIPDTTKWGN